MKNIFLMLILAMLPFWSCENKTALPTPADQCATISYSKNVAPIISKHCCIRGCHASGSPPGDLTTYEGLHAQIENGFFQSKVFEQKSMPPTDALNEGELETLKCWIQYGALSN